MPTTKTITIPWSRKLDSKVKALIREETDRAHRGYGHCANVTVEQAVSLILARALDGQLAVEVMDDLDPANAIAAWIAEQRDTPKRKGGKR